jgi:hypothetical protein
MNTFENKSIDSPVSTSTDNATSPCGGDLAHTQLGRVRAELALEDGAEMTYSQWSKTCPPSARKSNQTRATYPQWGQWEQGTVHRAIRRKQGLVTA